MRPLAEVMPMTDKAAASVLKVGGTILVVGIVWGTLTAAVRTLETTKADRAEVEALRLEVRAEIRALNEMTLDVLCSPTVDPKNRRC